MARGHPRWAADTDGIDGADNAGAFVDPETLRRARELGLDIRGFMAANDAWGFSRRSATCW